MDKSTNLMAIYTIAMSVSLPEGKTSFNTVINHYIPDYKPLSGWWF